MCGNFITHPAKTIEKEVANPLKTIEHIGEAALPIVGGIVGGPLGAAAGGAISGAVSGGGIKGALEGGALAGLSSEAISGLEGQFPGIQTAISNLTPDLGITDAINSLSTTLGIDASTLSSALSSAGLGSDTVSSDSGGDLVQGFGDAASSAAPVAGISSDPLYAGFGDDSDIIDPNSSLNSAVTAANASTGSPASAPVSSNVGSGTVGTPSVSSTISSSGGGSPDFTGFAGGPGGANIPGATDTFGGAFTPASTTPNSLQSFIKSPSFAGAENVITSNPGADIAAAGLGLDALKGLKPPSGEGALKTEASELSQQGTSLQSYLNSGTLPPGLQASINQASEAAKATIRSQYASKGMSGSSAEQQDLAAVDQRAQTQGAQQAMQLLQTGISESEAGTQIYEALLKNNEAEDAGVNSAISNFAAAAAGGSGGQTFKISPSA
jgi:hypothetical protein